MLDMALPCSSRLDQTGQRDNELNALELGQANGNIEKHNGALSMGARKPIPPILPDSDDYVVEFNGPDDPAYPINWDFTVKSVYHGCMVLVKHHC